MAAYMFGASPISRHRSASSRGPARLPCSRAESAASMTRSVWSGYVREALVDGRRGRGVVAGLAAGAGGTRETSSGA